MSTTAGRCMVKPRRFRRTRPFGPSCPSWCEVEHDIDFDRAEGLRHHSRWISEEVELVATDDLIGGTRGETRISVEGAGTTGRWARQLALSALEAVDRFGDGGR
ncbi:hypothetical protein ACQP2F_14345 [Actinoplanes sp. CA-030573]|uniref:hypothetical protein n=1 Tax=Actinoplanes sp. CA-030573 TaxID=3239898 RepID=UPI003D914DA9